MIEVRRAEDVSTSGKAVLHFWAAWSEPCKVMGAVMEQLSKEYAGIAFQRVEAEEVDALTVKFEISFVPTFIFLQDGSVVDKLEGADAPALTQKTAELFSGTKGVTASTAAAPSPAAGAVAGVVGQPAAGDVVGRIKFILSSSPVVLFMKGTPETPRCGFSRKVVEALNSVQVPFHTFDILTDEAIRAGVKEYSNWPTYPQLYVKGELVGGCDIILEMQGSGELKQLMEEKLGRDYQRLGAGAAASAATPSAAVAAAAAPAAAAPPATDKEAVTARIKALLASAPVMLFMKGAPEAPRCGFSSKVVNALRENGIQFSSFDILTDEAVRAGVKEYSNWPTYPQLYVKGELVGGCDIILEMQASGELKTAVEEMMYRMESTK